MFVWSDIPINDTYLNILSDDSKAISVYIITISNDSKVSTSYKGLRRIFYKPLESWKWHRPWTRLIYVKTGRCLCFSMSHFSSSLLYLNSWDSSCLSFISLLLDKLLLEWTNADIFYEEFFSNSDNQLYMFDTLQDLINPNPTMFADALSVDSKLLWNYMLDIVWWS